MTRVYATGLVTFNYPLPTSKARENYLVNFFEKQEMAEVIRTKVMVSAPMMALKNADEIIRENSNLLKNYIEIILPSDKKPVNMDKMSKDDKNKLKDTLKSLKDKLNTRPPGKNNSARNTTRQSR